MKAWFLLAFMTVVATASEPPSIDIKTGELQLAVQTDGPQLAVRNDELQLVKQIHGGIGPWAVAGYRIGRRALKELGLPRHSFSLDVAHYSPRLVQFSCMADGLQAATGASLGKLNLRLVETEVTKLSTVLVDRRSGRRLV